MSYHELLRRHLFCFRHTIIHKIISLSVLCFTGNDFLPHLPSLDIRDGAIDFLIESYKEMLPSLGNYITSPGGKVNLQQADVILGRVGEVEDEVFRRKKGAEENEERRRASYQKNPQRGPGGVILPPKDRARAEAESMNKMVKDGLVTQSLGPRPTNTYRADHPPSKPNTAAGPASTRETPSDSDAKAANNKEAALKLRGTILGKRKTAAIAGKSIKIEVDSKVVPISVDKLLKIEGGAIAIEAASSDVKDPVGDEEESEIVCKEEKKEKAESLEQIEAIDEEEEEEEEDEEEEEILHDADVVTTAELLSFAATVVPLTDAERARAKEEIKKRMKAKEGEMIDGLKTTLKDKVCLHETGWKSR